MTLQCNAMQTLEDIVTVVLKARMLISLVPNFECHILSLILKSSQQLLFQAILYMFPMEIKTSSSDSASSSFLGTVLWDVSCLYLFGFWVGLGFNPTRFFLKFLFSFFSFSFLLNFTYLHWVLCYIP